MSDVSGRLVNALVGTLPTIYRPSYPWRSYTVRAGQVVGDGRLKLWVVEDE